MPPSRLAAFEENEDRIRFLIEEWRYTYDQVLNYLSLSGPGTSRRSLRRFCDERGIGRTAHRVSSGEIHDAVRHAIEQNGPTYGRRMMTGVLQSSGLTVGETTIGQVLRDINPTYHAARVQGARNLNPAPYKADYFGHKFHIDQNEKLVRYGVTHVVMIDGYSRYIVGHASMPIKNNLTIYDAVYRPAVLTHGMPDTLRADKGKEFFLSLYAQHREQHQRFNTTRQPYIQSTSTKNHMIERIWCEVNNRFNYPVKSVLVDMDNNDQIDMGDDVTKYAVSQLGVALAVIGLNRIVQAWNAHPVQRKGIPNVLRHDRRASFPCPESFPPSEVLAAEYVGGGGALTHFSPFGRCPFRRPEGEDAARAAFAQFCPDVSVLLNAAVNGQGEPLRAALLHFINCVKGYATY